MSFIEFNYQVLQAYDFTVLARDARAATCRWAASDQWGNIVTGIDLGRRMGTHQLYALTDAAADHVFGRQDGQERRRRRVAQRGHARAPTISGSSGATPRTRDVGRFLRLFTDAADGGDRRGLRTCRAPRSTRPRRCWRPRSTAMLHGRDKAEAAAETARKTFEQGATGDRACPRSGSRRRSWPRELGVAEQALRGSVALVKSDRRGAAADRRRRPARQATRRSRTRLPKVTPVGCPRRRSRALDGPQAPRPAQAGVTPPARSGGVHAHYPVRVRQRRWLRWMPACAGMTARGAGTRLRVQCCGGPGSPRRIAHGEAGGRSPRWPGLRRPTSRCPDDAAQALRQAAACTR